MTRLEDLPTKEELIKNYYSWLLDNNDIKLEKEIDICLPVSDRDCFIYYPEIMVNLFHTEALQKLGRISQLSSMYQSTPGAWHSRLEHSIAVFGKKQEEHIYLWMNNPDFVRYIEENGLKKYLLAEEIKMLYHDVGHLPFSHPTEKEIIKRRGGHEEIGKDILLTDPEVVAILTRLGILEEVRTVLTEDVFNSNEHDEGNLDVDRKAYLQTDAIHIGTDNFNRYPIYSRKIAKVNEDGSYMKSPNGSILLTDTLGPDSKFIDVYAHSDISQVEGVLYGRENLYKNGYYSPTVLAHDTIMGLVQSKVAPANGKYCPDLQNYINFLNNGDYQSAKEYDEVDIFKSLIDLGLNCDNPDVVDMVSLVFVPFSNWLNLMHARLDASKDAEFIKSIRRNIIEGNSRFAKNLRDKNFFNENVILIEGENSSALKRKGLTHLIYNSNCVSAYNPSQPLYLEDKNGDVFALEDHPDKSRNWRDTRSYSSIAICATPWLRLQGLSPFKIADYVRQCQGMKSEFSIGELPSDPDYVARCQRIKSELSNSINSESSISEVPSGDER